MPILSPIDNRINTKGYIYKKTSKALTLEVAVCTGLEPVTPCVTGMYSNQLN